MQVPRDLLDQRLDSLGLVLPTLFAGSSPVHHETEFEKLSQDLLEQCQAEDRDYAPARLAKIRRAVGLSDGTDGI